MQRKASYKICVILLLVTVCAGFACAQAPPPRPRPKMAPTTAATIDTSEAMFTTMCALYAAGYEGDVNPDNWSAFRSQMRERLRTQQGPAVDALKEFYRGHQFRDPAAMLSRFVWFGLVSGPAPKFQPVLRRDELPPDVLDLEGFSEILSNYGAIETGRHRFFQTAGGQNEREVTVSRFVHLWQKTDSGWKISRALSYDHKGVN